MPIAKGLSSGYLPIGGVMVSDRIADVIIGKGKEFAHGFTYSGHPAACVVATMNLEIIEREGLVEQVRNETGPYLGQLWEQFKEHPLVGEVRTVGLLGAIELVEPRNVIGKSTVESLQSGAVYGFTAQIDGMVDRFRSELGSCTVVATGGLAHLIAPISETIEYVEPFLTLHGLRLVYNRNQETN